LLISRLIINEDINTMLTSVHECMTEEYFTLTNPTWNFYDDRFDCHKKQLNKNLEEFESHLSAAISNEKPAKIYCWDRKRYLLEKRTILMEAWIR